MAEAYATIAAHGKYCKPRVIDSIQYPDGTTKLGTPSQCTQAIAQPIADTAAAVLRGPIALPGATANANGQIGRPAGGKTGTTDGNNDAWFIGFVPQLSTAVWLGHTAGLAVLDKFRTLHPDEAWGPSAGQPVYGGGVPTIIWRKMMTAALAGVPVEDLPEADPTLAHGKTVTVPSVAGLVPDAAAQSLQDAGLSSTISTAPVPSTLAKGLVAGTNPGGGTDVPTGTQVTIYLSSGVAPTPSSTPTPTSPTPSASASGPPTPTPSSSATDGTPTATPPPPPPTAANGRGKGKHH
jgi:membrane peptidoglycan carboxypeptidase